MITALKWLIWCCVDMIVFLLLLYLFLVMQKLFLNRKEKRKQQRKHFYGPYLLKFLKDGEDSRVLHHLLKIDMTALIEMMQEYSQLLSAPEIQQRIQQFAEELLSVPFKKKMSAIRLSTRLNTLYAIEHFRLVSLSQQVKLRLDRPRLDEEERAQLLRILAVFRDRDLEKHLFGDTVLPEYIYRELFFNLGQDVFSHYMKSIDRFNTVARRCLLDIVGEKRAYEFLPVVESMMESEHNEERIRAIKAIERIGYLSAKQKLLHNALSVEWQERLMAAKAMGKIHWEDYVPPLTDLVFDSNWNVRTTAAQMLLNYSKGIHQLREIAATAENPDIRMTAVMCLEERI